VTLKGLALASTPFAMCARVSLAAEPVAPSRPRSPERSYRRRKPEDSILYQAVREHLDAFVSYARERSGTALPKYVVAEFRKYLRCGRLSEGFSRVWCPQCRHDFLVAFSCKSRGPCPSCAGRRMTDVSAQLADRVFAQNVPVRQWVLTVPRPLRLLLAKEPDVLSQVCRVFADEVERHYRENTAPDASGARRGAPGQARDEVAAA
jgi:hypothetical protein